MKTTLLMIFFLSCFAVVSCNAPEQNSKTPVLYTSEQLRNNISVSAAGFNKDETKVLVSSNESGIFNVYEINFADTSRTQLTNSTKESFFAVDYFKDNESFMYSSDKGGDENNHLFLLKKGEKSPKDLTPWEGSKNEFYRWSEDKKSMYFISNKRNEKYFDLWKMNTANGETSIIFQNDSSYEISALSKTEKYVTLAKSITTDKNELYLYNRTAKTTKKLSNNNEATWEAMAFEKNDNILYYTTNDGAEFSYLVKYNIKTGEKQKLFETNWDVVNFQLSNNEKYHSISINEDGKNKILLFDHANNEPVNFPEINNGDILNVIISDSEKNFLLTIGSSTSPQNLYVYNTEDKKLKQLTNSLNKAIDEKNLVSAEVIRYKSFDGKEIPAIYYKPLQADKNNKVGALVWVHGGPGGQSRVGFSNSIQFLVNHGYAVLAVNNRGSSGYGKTFYKLDNKDHGYGDMKDCIWAKKWLMEQEYIDSSAIGIYGGSYGGNMVLNALCLHPDEFKVGVNLFGVANWLRTLRSIPPYWESFRKALYDEMGDPNTKDSVLLKNTSPLYNYQKIKKPLLVFQGANDVRVLKIESDEIVEGVKKNGVFVDYVIYKDEGHGFIKKENLITTDNKVLEFLDKYLKTKPKQ